MPDLASNITPESYTGPLIGRDAELQQVIRLLGDGVPSNAGGRRLVTLCGCHGVGKSALAMAAARRLVSSCFHLRKVTGVGRFSKHFTIILNFSQFIQFVVNNVIRLF